MKKSLLGAVGAVMCVAGSCVQAQGLKAVGALPGYSCMSINVTPEEMQHENALPVIRNVPSPTASMIGRASAQVIVADPVRALNGFLSVLTLDNRPGWVRADQLKPYRSLSNPNARCIASKMSDGTPGFSYVR